MEIPISVSLKGPICLIMTCSSFVVFLSDVQEHEKDVG